MKDANGKNIRDGAEVSISENTIRNFKLTIKSGFVIDCKYNLGRLVTVSTSEGVYDFNSKSLRVR